MKRQRRALGTGLSRSFAILATLALLASVTACDIDSYADPSNVGRWENTPVILPILKRLDVIEEPEQSLPGLSQITSEDLIPVVSEYVLGPGDLITVTVFELITPNVESVQTRRIDELGFIRLPIIGQIKAGGLTTKQLEQEIVDILHPNILRDPTVTVIVQEGRQKTFAVIGAVGGVGTYSILKSDFRLLDAIALARGIPDTVEKVYVIRQVPLSDLVEGRTFGERGRPGAHRPPLQPSEQDGEGAGDPGALIEDLLEGDLDGDGGDAPANDDAPGQDNDADDAPTDLGEALDLDAADATAGTGGGAGRWVNVGGKWVRVTGQQPTEDQGLGDEQALPAPEELVTQRIIEIDAEQLQRGVARYNIVVRPGDVIRVPAPETGNIFIGGEIARPGTYALPSENTLTLKQAIISAGGLAPTAIPERVDLTRRVGDDHEATLRLNLRAIFEGVQPDIYLKPHDTINIGTNAWAGALAVIRNAFRFSYGFGFLLDRNFGTQVFGPLPRNTN